MARNNKKRKSRASIKYESKGRNLEFTPVNSKGKTKASSTSSSNNILQAVTAQLRKNKGAIAKPSGLNQKDLSFVTDLFNNNPSEQVIKDFKKNLPELASNKALLTEALKSVKDPGNLGSVARGLGIGIEDPRVQSQFKKIVSGADITSPTEAATTNTNNVYKDIYVPPKQTKAAARPSTTSRAFKPVGSPKNNMDYSFQQSSIGNAPNTVTSQIQSSQPTATYNYKPVESPVVASPQQQAIVPTAPVPYNPIIPPTPTPVVDTGLPQPFQVGGNAPIGLGDSQIPIEAPNTGLQYNGLGITNNTPTGVVPSLNTGLLANRPAVSPPPQDNGFNFTRKSMFGDDKNIGWLTGGAQVASGIMDIYNGYKATKLAREQYELKKNSYKLDYKNQAQLLNRDILRQEKNFAAIRNSGTPVKDRQKYYETIDRQANKAYQKNKLDVNAANNL